MLKHIKQTVRSMLNRYPQWLCRDEYESQEFSRFNERPVEIGFLFRKISELYPKTVLDVGTGMTALPHLIWNCGCLVTATDNVKDYWPNGMMNRHFHVIHDDITQTKLTGKYDLITCISTLEHIKKPDAAMRCVFSLLNHGGHIILTCPYSEKNHVENVYDLPGSSYGQGESYSTQSFSRKDLVRWLYKNSGVIIDQEYWQFWDGDYWTVGNQIIPPKKVGSDDRHQLTCALLGKK